MFYILDNIRVVKIDLLPSVSAPEGILEYMYFSILNTFANS